MEVRTGNDGRLMRGVGAVVMESARVVSIVHLPLGNPRKTTHPRA